MGRPEVVIFTPSPEERLALADGLEGHEFVKFTVRVEAAGPGKINTAASVAAFLTRSVPPGGEKPLLVIGAGVAHSLDMKLRAGEVIASGSAIIGDWMMESDYVRTYGAYGQPVYRALNAQAAGELSLNCPSPLVRELADRLRSKGFLSGRILTTDTYAVGFSQKLARGRLFDCPAGDSESGALAWVAEQYGRPWFNLRVVADTMDETVRETQQPDLDTREILVLKTVVALSTLDQMPVSPG